MNSFDSKMQRLSHVVGKIFRLLRQGRYGDLKKKILSNLRSPGESTWEWIIAPFDTYIWSGFRSTEDTVIRIVPGEQSVSNDEEFRLVLFAHYDPDGLVDDYVMYQLSHFAVLPAAIVFVSTAALSDAALEKLRPLCHTIILRKNIGWDFGSWKAGMDLCPALVEQATTLILTNDSCYGPFHPLREIVEALESKHNCLTGITANHKQSFHIQSYFMLFPKETLKSKFFSEFRKSLKYLRSKREIIKQFELGTSRLAQRHGIALYFWVQEDDLLQAGTPPSKLKQDLTLFNWEILLLENLSPFLKRSLFGNFRELLESREHLMWEYVRDRTDYPLSLIKNHLSRSKAQMS